MRLHITVPRKQYALPGLRSLEIGLPLPLLLLAPALTPSLKPKVSASLAYAAFQALISMVQALILIRVPGVAFKPTNEPARSVSKL